MFQNEIYPRPEGFVRYGVKLEAPTDSLPLVTDWSITSNDLKMLKSLHSYANIIIHYFLNIDTEFWYKLVNEISKFDYYELEGVKLKDQTIKKEYMSCFKKILWTYKMYLQSSDKWEKDIEFNRSTFDSHTHYSIFVDKILTRAFAEYLFKEDRYHYYEISSLSDKNDQNKKWLFGILLMDLCNVFSFDPLIEKEITSRFWVEKQQGGLTNSNKSRPIKFKFDWVINAGDILKEIKKKKKDHQIKPKTLQLALFSIMKTQKSDKNAYDDAKIASPCKFLNFRLKYSKKDFDYSNYSRFEKSHSRILLLLPHYIDKSVFKVDEECEDFNAVLKAVVFYSPKLKYYELFIKMDIELNYWRRFWDSAMNEQYDLAGVYTHAIKEELFPILITYEKTSSDLCLIEPDMDAWNISLCYSEVKKSKAEDNEEHKEPYNDIDYEISSVSNSCSGSIRVKLGDINKIAGQIQSENLEGMKLLIK